MHPKQRESLIKQRLTYSTNCLEGRAANRTQQPHHDADQNWKSFHVISSTGPGLEECRAFAARLETITKGCITDLVAIDIHCNEDVDKSLSTYMTDLCIQENQSILPLPWTCLSCYLFFECSVTSH
jgi:hypothetical protein